MPHSSDPSTPVLEFLIDLPYYASSRESIHRHRNFDPLRNINEVNLYSRFHGSVCFLNPDRDVNFNLCMNSSGSNLFVGSTGI